MAITVKHKFVSAIPDAGDPTIVQPSNWNDDHQLTGTVPVANGGTGAATLTGYVIGNGTSAMTASTTIPSGDVSGLGTIATQNANAVAITGGTVNGTTIGATTASTGAFTYLSTSSSTSTTPTLSFNASNSPYAAGATISGSYLQHLLQNKSGTAGASTNYVLSNDLGTDSTYYGEFGMNSSVYSSGTPADFFSLNNGIYFSGHDGDLTIGSGNGYKTFLAWGTVGQSAHVINASGALGLNTNITGTSNFGTSGQVLTSAGSSATPTWNTPTIAGFTSGESTATPNGTVYVDYLQASGASTNADIAIVPKGTGAVLAQIPDNATTGGNKRGANAVDWQTGRGSATNVASASSSFIGAGSSNTASGNFSGIVAGLNNNPQSTGNFIGAGNGNASNSPYSSVVGGYQNSALGYINFVGGGQSNSGTSASAVTTQSATMNATTAVTLAATNANIKVGQLITGTSIATYTYVAAISGTALTLSQAASGSSTSTLSFYTPHGVVVGGGNNQATGSYSFIGGGGDAGTAANRNVASGDWSFVGGGSKNVASGAGSVIVGGGINGGGIQGQGHTASGIASSILGGFLNQAQATGSTVVGGSASVSSGTYGTVMGRLAADRSISGNTVFSASNQPIAVSIGVSQAGLLVLGRQTTDATATVLCSDAASASGTNQVILPNNSAYYFKGTVIAGVTGAGNTKGWTIEGVIKRGAGVGTTALVGSPTVMSSYADVGAATWAVTATADTTNGGLAITVTGQAATTIRWVCKIETTEMTY